MLENINTPRMRALLYGLILLSSLAVFGNVAELCDIANTCPARLAVVIAIGVFAAIVSGVLFIGTVFGVAILLSLESILSTLLLVAFSVCGGLASSFRTNLQETIALSFSWVGLGLAFIVTFLAFTSERVFNTEKRINRRSKDLEAGEGASEKNYMEAVGDDSMAGPEGSNQDQSEPMVPLEEPDKASS